MKFSFVIPVYNVEKYVERSVRSVLSGNKEELEILLVDDGSTDRSGEICDRLAEAHPEVRVFHKENGGPSEARNLALRNATGDYVLFLDSDDYMSEGICHILEKALSRWGMADALCFDGVEDDGTSRVPMRKIPLDEEICTEDGKTYLLRHYKNRNMNVEACVYAFRRGFLTEKNLWFLDGSLHEDVEFTLRALLECGKVIELPDCIYHYMIRENSISTKKDQLQNAKDLFSVLEVQCRIAEGQEPELRRWMKNAILDSYLSMIQNAQMYRRPYRPLLKKSFLLGKAATNWNRFRVLVCLINVRLYCMMNDGYKALARMRRA